MIRTVTLIDTTTYRTGLGRIAWVNCDNWNTHQFSFVLDKLAELVKRPVRVSCPLLALNRYPVADTLKVFEGDPASGVLRSLHNTLADAVVGVSLVTLLLAGYLAELMLRGARSLALQVAATVGILAALVFYRHATIRLAIAICREVDNAKIDAEKPIYILRLWSFDIAGDEQIELAADMTQVGLAPVAIQKLALAVAALVGHTLATFECPDVDSLLAGLKTEDTVVIGKRAVWLEDALCLLVKFVGVCDFGDRSHNYLCGQRVAFANVVVDDLVEAELAKDFALPRLLANVVAGGISRLKCLEQRVTLFRRRSQLDLRSQFHIVRITYPTERCKPIACPSFLSPLKGGVSRRRF